MPLATRSAPEMSPVRAMTSTTDFKASERESSSLIPSANQPATYSESPQNVTLTATVTTADGSLVNDGTVIFTVRNIFSDKVAHLNTTVTNGSASVVYNLPGWTAGSPASLTRQGYYNVGWDITANYSSGDDFLASTCSAHIPVD